MRIAIIGGGMAGLGAAYEIVSQHPEYSVSIIEKSASLGGLASSLTVGDVPIEHYYHHMFPTYYDFFEVAKKLGFYEKMYFKNAKTAIYHEGVLYPFSTAIDLLRFKPLSVLDRIRTGIVTLYLKCMKRWRQFEHHTASTWLRTYYGEQSYRVIWYPLLKSKFGDDAERISMVWFWSRVFERPKQFGYIEGGFKTFIDELAAYLELQGVTIHTDTPVTSITKEGGMFVVTSQMGTEQYDTVIVAAPAEPFGRMGASVLPQSYRETLSTYKFMGSICVLLILKQKLTNYYWTNINDDSSPFVAIVEHTNFVSDETYHGLHPVYVSRYISTTDPLYKASEKEVLDIFIEHLKKTTPSFSEDLIVERHVFRAPYTQPVVPAHYENQRPSFRTPVDGLWWISMSHVYPWDRGTDHSFHFGRSLARELLHDGSH